MQHMMLTAETCCQKKRHYLRVDFHVVPKADVVDDMVSELMSVKGCKSAEATIHRHILSRQDVVILCAHLVWNLQTTLHHNRSIHMPSLRYCQINSHQSHAALHNNNNNNNNNNNKFAIMQPSMRLAHFLPSFVCPLSACPSCPR